ncbi:hypothetical protein VK98_20545 [Chromobacterium sp. LK11]|uniref:GNAT family N-acetyltransferase n=1 Tax=Chromobacterium sp. LK11 TaxID=1628212 RepID=UPI000653E2CA|nr:GNAT family protein [Chromobacterium sp. LK11]KMN76598.1 hypothetical protein VK98_20545 [Chromobacterium sp. LK11]
MNVITPPSIDLQGFSLRPMEMLDIPDWYDYLRLPEVAPHLRWELQSAADLAPLVQAYRSEEPGAPLRLAIVDDDSGGLAGSVGFDAVWPEDRSAEINFDLAPAYWGRGLGQAACQAVTAWAFAGCRLYRVQAVARDGNRRAERLLRGCGFQYEGLLRAYRQVRGEPGDFKMFARLSIDPDAAT